MCLAVPGKIITIREEGDGTGSGPLGTVDFQGSRLEVGLLMTPQAREGDWVLVHAGFALEVLKESDAREMWQYLELAGIVGKMPPELKSAESSTESDDR